jgi:hypothetical protein
MTMIAAAIVFALLLGSFIFMVLPRGRVWQRAVSTSMFMVLLGLVYGGAVELLGQPKPMRLEWRSSLPEAELVGASMKEGEAIYILLQFADGGAPQYYELPWSQKMAEQLQKAQREGQANGTGVKVKTAKGQPGDDPREPMFYAMPQPALPDKNYADGSGTLFYQQPGTSP